MGELIAAVRPARAGFLLSITEKKIFMSVGRMKKKQITLLKVFGVCFLLGNQPGVIARGISL